MLAMTERQWLILAVAAVAYVLISIHVAIHMGRLGHSRRRWFVISLLLTALPAAVVATLHQLGVLTTKPKADGPLPKEPTGVGERLEAAATAQTPKRRESPPLVRCPHCGARSPRPDGRDGRDISPRCPRCDMPLEEEKFA